MALLSGLFAKERCFFGNVHSFLKFSPNVAFVTLDPLFNLVVLPVEFYLLWFSLGFSNLAAELLLHPFCLFSFLLFLLLFLYLFVDKIFEPFELDALGVGCFLKIFEYFSVLRLNTTS